MNFTKLSDELGAWLKRAERTHKAAITRAATQFQQDIAVFSTELAAYRYELQSAEEDRRTTQSSESQTFEARPGASEFLRRHNRGEEQGGELRTLYDEYTAKSRAAAERSRNRKTAAENAFAPYRQSLQQAQQKFDSNKLRADQKLAAEQHFVSTVLAQIDHRQRTLRFLSGDTKAFDSKVG